jgi:hypothetical protein
MLPIFSGRYRTASEVMMMTTSWSNAKFGFEMPHTPHRLPAVEESSQQKKARNGPNTAHSPKGLKRRARPPITLTFI